MKISPDFSEAQDIGTPFPEATFKTRITGCEQKTSKAGATYLSWTLDVFGADGEFSTYNNRKIWLNTMISGPGAGILKSFVKAALKTTEVPKNFDTDTLLGKELLVTTKPSFYEGQERSNPEIKKMMPLN